MKKITIIIGVWLIALPVFAAELYVDDGGTDADTCVVEGSPCATLEFALSHATAGDTIHIAEGTYSSTASTYPLMIGDGVNMSGAGYDLTHFNANTAVALFLIGDNQLPTLLKGMAISNLGGIGLQIGASSQSAVLNLTLSDMMLHDNGGVAINYQAHQAPLNFTLKNSVIKDNVGSGLDFDIGSISEDIHILLSGNTIRSNNVGVALDLNGVDGCLLEVLENDISGNDNTNLYFELYTVDKMDVLIENNALDDAGSNGVAGYLYSDILADITLRNNSISNNANDGLYFNLMLSTAYARLLVEGNDLVGNQGFGAFVAINDEGQNALDATLRNNTIQNNSTGISLHQSASSSNHMSVLVENNAIIENDEDGVYIRADYGLIADLYGNVIADNNTNGVHVNSGAYGYQLYMRHNTFRSNTDYAFYQDRPNDGMQTMAPENWWGSIVQSTIAELVHDYNDNGSGGILLADNPLEDTLHFEALTSSAPEEGGNSILIQALEDAPPFVATAGIFELVVLFGATPALSVEVINAGRALYAVAPPHAPGVVDISITNPGGQSGLLYDAFEFTHTLNDSDNDGVIDDLDNCAALSNTTQTDTDLDGVGDDCDDDDDGDGIADDSDNCVLVSNADQTNLDGDELGDACDGDFDGDDVLDAADNCPAVANADQANQDRDATGDVCDEDDDNDGVPDTTDNCLSIQNIAQLDMDSDGVGDACDDDMDGNGIADDQDIAAAVTESGQPIIIMEDGGCSATGGHSGLIPFALFGLALAFIRRRQA